jgi:lipopolysaccharide transport system ATP-binding protein
MSDIVISVEDVGKCYTLKHKGNDERYRYATLRDVVARQAMAPFQAIGKKMRVRSGPNGSSPCVPISSLSHNSAEKFWALKGASFQVKQGDVLGIIGRNGAGKSTLLKILSRITEPTEGRIRIKGRVATLLEVGTGFHPELTGRENIYLNGGILGMSRAETKAKFDEIVAFAEVEKFLDTPVKRYSSGMYVRLAFAVAAHLEPEILVVDEVLAVGDAPFQEKCLGKMKQVSRSEGRTVIFVSHNIGAIQSICSRAIIVTKGQITFDGKVQEAVSHYLHDHQSEAVVTNFKVRQGTGEARITSVRLADDDSNLQTHFRMGEPLNIIVRAHFFSKVKDPILGVNILTDTGIMVADCRSSHSNLQLGMVTGDLEYLVRIETLTLYPRTYCLEPWITDSRDVCIFDWVRDAATFLVNSSPHFLSGANVNANHGILFIPTSFAIHANDAQITTR